jgi:hypothetical protein
VLKIGVQLIIATVFEALPWKRTSALLQSLYKTTTSDILKVQIVTDLKYVLKKIHQTFLCLNSEWLS